MDKQKGGTYMDMQMGSFRRMMHRFTRRVERMWNRMTDKAGKKLEL